MTEDTREYVATTRIPHAFNERLQVVAQRLGISKAEVMYRAMRNGLEDLEFITTKAEHPAINLGLRLAVLLAGNEEEQRRVCEQLDAVAEYRRSRNQPTLPGIST